MTHETLTRQALNRALLARQMLLARESIPALDAIERLVGLQAQEARPPFVGLWSRLDGFERGHLLDLLHGRQVVRATLMRATLHLMSARDYLPLRGALRPLLAAALSSVLGDRAVGLDVPAIVAAARPVLAERPRTFTELRAALVEAFPETPDERAMGYALRTHHPLVAVPDDSAWGYRADPRFTDAEAWLGHSVAAGEAPVPLVLRYLAAFGPASAADVQAWSGLKGLKPVLDALRPELVTFRDERKRELFDLPDAPRPPAATPAPARFVAAYDNLILAHADRTRIIADAHRPLVVSRNLRVAPTFLVDGFVAGTWAAARARAAATLTVSPFAPLPPGPQADLTEEAERLVRFLEPDAATFDVRFEAPPG